MLWCSLLLLGWCFSPLCCSLVNACALPCDSAGRLLREALIFLYSKWSPSPGLGSCWQDRLTGFVIMTSSRYRHAFDFLKHLDMIPELPPYGAGSWCLLVCGGQGCGLLSYFLRRTLEPVVGRTGQWGLPPQEDTQHLQTLITHTQSYVWTEEVLRSTAYLLSSACQGTAGKIVVHPQA